LLFISLLILLAFYNSLLSFYFSIRFKKSCSESFLTTKQLRKVIQLHPIFTGDSSPDGTTVFPPKPVKVKRMSGVSNATSLEPLPISEDPDGVFKTEAREIKAETVKEDEHTKVDLPIDQVILLSYHHHYHQFNIDPGFFPVNGNGQVLFDDLLLLACLSI